MTKTLPKFSCVMITICAILTCLSCDNKTKSGFVESVVKEHVGKNIARDNLLFDYIQKTKADFYLVNFIDSVGCTACKMRVKTWDMLLEEIKHFYPTKKVKLIYVVAENAIKEATDKLEEYDIPQNYELITDTDEKIKIANNISDRYYYQTLLIDRHGEVRAVGNPAVNPKIKELYFAIIEGRSYIKTETTGQAETVWPNEKINIGEISSDSEHEISLEIKNVSSIPFLIKDVVPSCDCMDVDFSKEKIGKNKKSIIKVTFSEKNAGELYRTITIYSNSDPPIKEIEFIGNVRKAIGEK